MLLIFTPKILSASSSFSSTLRVPCAGTLVFDTVCLSFSSILRFIAALLLSSAAFSISSSSLFDISDSGLLLHAMISTVSSNDNLLLYLDLTLFLFPASAFSSPSLFPAALLVVIFVCVIRYEFARLLEPFCPLFLMLGGFDPFSWVRDHPPCTLIAFLLVPSRVARGRDCRVTIMDWLPQHP